jgi:hypothetical protein
MTGCHCTTCMHAQQVRDRCCMETSNGILLAHYIKLCIQMAVGRKDTTSSLGALHWPG